MVENWLVLLFFGWLAATVSGAAGFGGALILLPGLVPVVGVKAAVPILTVAQLLGNASRAAFGWREIRWRPALVFSVGAVPASVIGARLFGHLPSATLTRLIGGFVLVVVALRRTPLGERRLAEGLLPVAGAGVGFLSGIAGSAGPLGATVFLSLQLPAQAYISSEAVTAVLMHLTKSITYGRYATMTLGNLGQGLALGSSMVAGSWTGRMLARRLPDQRFALMVEVLLIASAVCLLIGPR